MAKNKPLERSQFESKLRSSLSLAYGSEIFDELFDSKNKENIVFFNALKRVSLNNFNKAFDFIICLDTLLEKASFTRAYFEGDFSIILNWIRKYDQIRESKDFKKLLTISETFSKQYLINVDQLNSTILTIKRNLITVLNWRKNDPKKDIQLKNKRMILLFLIKNAEEIFGEERLGINLLIKEISTSKLFTKMYGKGFTTDAQISTLRKELKSSK